MLEKLAVVSAIALPLIAVLYMALRDNIRPQLEDRAPRMEQISNQSVIDVLF